MFLRFKAVLIATATVLATASVLAVPGNGNGIRQSKMFGKGNPFTIDNLPPGRSRTRLKTMRIPARRRAMRWLHRFDFPVKDLESMVIDNDGAVLYVDPAQPEPATEEEQAGDADGTFPEPAATAAEDAFLLHSRPGAPNSVYLDFDGHTFSGTAWSSGTIHARPFDLDGTPSAFNNTERSAIAEIWHRVAEDFAAFDINVTTEEPANFDPYTGHVLITSNTDTNGGAMPYSSAGGVSYVGAWGFSNYASYYSPALVYYDNLAKNPTSIAEASTHEFGHNLGLSHDGTNSVTYYAGHGSGATSWAPIMGNSYYNNVTQWSKGEYSGANNTQDDIAIIASKLYLVDDDHGDTLNDATPLVVDGNGEILVSNPESDPYNTYAENKGVIETPGDHDVFYFDAAAGQVDLTVTPAWDAFHRTSRRGANLDVGIILFDSDGNQITASDPTSDTSASISTIVSDGTYHLEVTGVGNGNYSDYASNGQYFISGTISSNRAPNAPPIANFDFSCVDLSCSFTDASSDGNGNVIAWSWDFGDGANSTAQDLSHSYATDGTYTVILTVTDDDGATATVTKTLTVNSPPSPPPANIIDFNDYPLSSFTTSEDRQGTASIEDGGATLRLVGNTWKRISFPYTVSPQTVIEFDFYSGVKGEIHGIALEENNGLTPERIFKLYGTQGAGIRDFDNYPGSGWIHYRIPVGQFYSGNMAYLVFAMDDDATAAGESRFRNLTVYDDSPAPASNIDIDFNDYPLSSFTTSQDRQGTASIEDGGATLRLVGNTWKRISFPYAVRPQTVIEFDFYSGVKGEIHGIGLEENNGLTPERIFKLYGTQGAGIRDFDNYPGSGWMHYRIPVGQFYRGNMAYLVFAMDDDVTAAGESRFRNLTVYDE